MHPFRSRLPSFYPGRPSHSPETGQKACPKLWSSFRRPAYVSYRRFALYSRLAMGCRPFEPRFRKTELNEEKTHARSTAVVIRVHPEERDLLKLNAGIHGMSVSDYVRQTCLGLRLRRTPEEKRRLRELARIGSNLNQIARWANTYKESLEAVEVIAALTSLEMQIENFASSATGESAEESTLADESIPPRHGRW